MLSFKKSRLLAAGLFVSLASIVAAGCGCNDYVPECYALSVRVDPNAVPEGGFVEITTDEGVSFDCADTMEFRCYEDEGIRALRLRPKTVYVRILDQDAVEVAAHEFSPRYNGKSNQDACGGGCSDFADIRVRASR